MPNASVFGIDLGTTNSCIARWEGQGVRIFNNAFNQSVTPSVIRLLNEGGQQHAHKMVGSAAYNATVYDPDNTAREFKRWIGQADRFYFPAIDRALSAEELSAEVLHTLMQDVYEQTGEQVEAAVITVPAAFGSLQCEATARAAAMAGLKYAPLLQEPIAAAIAYGIDPRQSSEQRWMVFDLGGGTLDVAIVSTRDGRLSVLEHRGNNQLGGKDLDRVLVESVFLPRLRARYTLFEPSQPEFHRLMRQLLFRAEEARKGLSFYSEIPVHLYDLGTDQNGHPLDLEFMVYRHEFEAAAQPFITQCLNLVEQALQGARLTGSQVDRVLLVGGPTQTPCIQAGLEQYLGIPVDASLDPMTVVALGAAVYASMLTYPQAASACQARQACSIPEGIHFALGYEQVSNTLYPTLEGQLQVQFLSPQHPVMQSVRVASLDGQWQSNRVPLDETGYFEMTLCLEEGQQRVFRLLAFDVNGQEHQVYEPDFAIRHGLVLSAPPLPHSISVEITKADGQPVLDPIFVRGTPLPTPAKTIVYRANRTLLPEQLSEYLAIKLWEGEYFEDPQANLSVATLLIKGEELNRPIPEGAKIELSLNLDESRRLSVSAFVPHLEETFSKNLFVPERDEEEFSLSLAKVPEQLVVHHERLSKLESHGLQGVEGVFIEQLHQVANEIHQLEQALQSLGGNYNLNDPDYSRQLVVLSRQIRNRLARLELRLGPEVEYKELVQNFAQNVSMIQENLGQYGSSFEQKELEILLGQAQHAMQQDDERALRRTNKELWSLWWRVVSPHDWYWRNTFNTLKNQRVANEHIGQRWLDQGEEALCLNNLGLLKEAVRNLQELRARNAGEVEKDQSYLAGIRMF